MRKRTRARELALQILYQIDLLDPHEENAFEAHLLDCDACFDALCSLDRAAIEAMQSLIEEHAAEN